MAEAPERKPRKAPKDMTNVLAARKTSGNIFRQAWKSHKTAGRTGRLTAAELKAARLTLGMTPGPGPGGGTTTH